MKKRISTRVIKKNGICTGIELVQYLGQNKIVMLLNEREMEYLWEQIDTSLNENDLKRRVIKPLGV